MILLVDNYDSYTFNLAHLIATVAGRDPLVVPALRGEDLPERVRDGEFSHVVISPGPGTPEREEDFGLARRVIEAAADASIPLLGVCLGHQGLGMLAGAAVARAPQPRHGYVSKLRHSGEGLFAGIPQDFEVVRYHSLHVEEVPGVTVHARSEDNVVQALEVDGLPHWGVQFHPESVLTQYGELLMRNFLALAPLADQQPPKRPAHRFSPAAPTPWHVTHRSIPGPIDCQGVFNALRASNDSRHVFWLDSADMRGRYSLIGDAYGRSSRVVRYQLGDDPDIFAELERELAVGITDPPDLPFTGGVVGYLGYECAQLTLPEARLGSHTAPTPDAYFVRPESWILYDHHTETAHICCLHAGRGASEEASEEVLRRLEEVLAKSQVGAVGGGVGASLGNGSWRTSDYLDRIVRAQTLLHAGESYEVCLTDTFETAASGEIYSQLRTHNPAPYAAYLSFGDVEVTSASPERFLTVRGGRVEAKPIKGTIARGEDPAALQRDPKTRAENLMIVDLLRNDLSRVCLPGTVEVPKLMEVETYTTVHQLVSTITGQLRDNATLTDLLRATFPPGSMTGAPKLRTCEIIEQLETGPRGVYSGALGYLGFDGQADLSVVIRTAVRQGSRMTVGAGGAIVLDSDPAAEMAEKQLKADAVLGAWR